MRTSRSLLYRSPAPTVVALGCFDGVHLGHRAVICRAVEIAKGKELTSLVWTFEEPAKNFFVPGSVPLITTWEEKKTQIRRLGIDVLVCGALEPAITSLSPKDFFEKILIERLNAKHLVCGFNYSFGQGGRGDTALLGELCRKHGIGLTVIPAVSMEGLEVSSTQIRAAVEDGRPADAAVLLGRPYALRTIVIDGQKLARRLGFPTLNQVFRRGALVPKRGVYVTRIRMAGKEKHGITNVGIRPTVGGSLLCAETHIFDFEGDLYGKTVTVEFLHFLRAETKFDSVELLSEQVRTDIEQAQLWLKSRSKKHPLALS